jgi:quercetin dioxygenase-like cupin family protein
MAGSDAPARRVRTGLAVLAAVVVLAACGDDGGDDTSASTTTTGESDMPIVREELAETSPANAPGQQLYLQRVTIEPGARLDTHLHEGTQIARVVEGTLTYDIVEGPAEVARRDGTVERFTGPDSITLEPGDALTETQDLVHFGSNDGETPVVILLAALLADGAPLATPVPE